MDAKLFCDKCNVEIDSPYTHKHCPKCNAPPSKQEIRNYSMMWHDGDVYCSVCNTYVRRYDAG